MVNSTVITPIEGDVALQAKEKREFLFKFYDNMMKGGDILSPEDIDIVMESLKLAQLDLKEREKRKLIERKAEKEESLSEISPWEALKEKENDGLIPDKDFEIEHIVRERTLYKDGTAKVTRTENWTLKKYRGHDEHVVIPDYITSIAYQAFLKCDTIKTVSIPQSVKVIGSYAFCGCKSLESICIPKNVREIRECAFTGCENLKSAYFEHEKYMGNLSLWAFRRANNVTLYGTEKALGWLRNYKKDVPPFELHD